MDEEEEIDIVGYYDNFGARSDQEFSKISCGQILSCDYTVHPNWISDNAENGSYWTESVPKNENLESNVEILHSEEVVIEDLTQAPKISDVEWRDELGQDGYLVFEEDIPASIEEVVSNYDTDDTNVEKTSPSSEHLDLETVDTELPKPPQKCIKFIRPTHSRSLLKVKMTSPSDVGSSPPQTLVKNGLKSAIKTKSKFKQSLLVNPHLMKVSENVPIPRKLKPSEEKTSMKPPKSKPKSIKFKETVKMIPRNIPNMNNAMLVKTTKKPNRVPKGRNTRVKKQKKIRIVNDENITISHEMENVVVENSVQTIPAVQLNESDSDAEIDIESDHVIEGKQISCNSHSEKSSVDEPNTIQKHLNSYNPSQIQIYEEEESIIPPLEQRFPDLSADLLLELGKLDVPTEEISIDPNEVSNLEKFIHSDFFENRSTKTQEQYLRIRNHILNAWRCGKPNYVSKTAVRNGLKHGGDVNCISRIHRLLEQIGAINFGLAGKYFDYVRPLERFMSLFIQMPRNRTNSNSYANLEQYKKRRPRFRTIGHSGNDTENATLSINYTIAHNGSIQFASEAKSKTDQHIRKRQHVRSEFDLIKCFKFTEESTAPFSVSITLSTLLCLRLHALSSQYEVMGFMGGCQQYQSEKLRISLTKYKPCETSMQSGTSCEMCPVSQVEQANSLQTEGYELLGWFHSHPLFPANPSRTDIKTQQEMQLLFSYDGNRPFIGLILSCLDMSLKSIYMVPEKVARDRDEDKVPYELTVDITEDLENIVLQLSDVLVHIRDEIVDLNDLYEKFKSSSEVIFKQYGCNYESLLSNIFKN